MARKIALTPASIDTHQKGLLADLLTPGLAIEVLASGKKRWRYRRQVAGTKTMATLYGQLFPAHSIGDAREWARALNEKVEAGIDPREALRQEKATARPSGMPTSTPGPLPTDQRKRATPSATGSARTARRNIAQINSTIPAAERTSPKNMVSAPSGAEHNRNMSRLKQVLPHYRALRLGESCTMRRATNSVGWSAGSFVIAARGVALSAKKMPLTGWWAISGGEAGVPATSAR